MNNLRIHKFKLSSPNSGGGGVGGGASAANTKNNKDPNTGANKNNDVNENNHNDNNGNTSTDNGAVGGGGGGGISGTGGGMSLLTRFKRYSTFSNKISRRHLSSNSKNNINCSGHVSPTKLNTGSYHMSGGNSEDHRLEIGAPILISTTTLDTDRFGVTEARLKQIGGGIAVNSNLVASDSTQSSPQIPSSGSEFELFVDALSTPQIEEDVQLQQKHKTNEQKSEKKTKVIANTDADAEEFVSSCEAPAHEEPNTDVTDISQLTAMETIKLNDLIEKSPPLLRRLRLAKQQVQSKSVQNLHRSELQVLLHRSPSVILNMNVTAPELNVPELPELHGESVCSLAETDVQHNSSPPDSPVLKIPTLLNSTTNLYKCESNTFDMCAEQKVCGFLAQQQLFRSIDSLEFLPEHCVVNCATNKRYSTLYTSNMSVAERRRYSQARQQQQQQQQLLSWSKHSLVSCDSQRSQRSQLSQHSHNSSALENFDLKSVSYQSLNAQNLFVSIDELNEITRQINESEEFNREIDLEYCTHRDNLKPSERRITLMKNKNSKLISFNHNKEKIKKSWNGVKQWLGEESTRLKEVVQKQTPLKRLGQSKLNLNQMDGSLLPSRESRECSPRVQNTTATSLVAHTELIISCDNVIDQAADELESMVTQRASDDEHSPHDKRFRDEGQNGFEELRRYVKQGGDFSKELILILQERVDSELIYSKSLSKMANKLNKACRELPGSIADAWRGVATEMESRSDIHRQLAGSLTDEIVKPLKIIVDSHHKARKSVESNVDKAARVLSEWRVSEAKAKKASHTAARENEKLQDAMLDVRIQKSPSIALLHQGPNKTAAEREIKSAEKDCIKLDNKRKKAEEAVKRADVEYYTLCVRAERARVDWEMAVLRGSSQLQSSENQRLINMKNFVTQYTRLTADMNPILNGLVQSLQPQVDACNAAKDMQVVKNIRYNSEGPSEQLLPDFYCEHTTLAMNRERRKHALIKLLQLVKTDLERERRSRDGLRGLSQSLNSQEHQNITDKLYHIRSMLTYLEGARLKLHSALLELDHKPRTTHPLAQHIQITRDRTGLQQSILKVPNWLKNNDKLNNSNADDSVRDYCSGSDNNNTDAESCLNQSHNISCANLPLAHIGTESSHKHFKRSKSNIENFSSNPKIICTAAIATNAANAKVPAIKASISKSKTLGTSHVSEAYNDRGQADGGSNQQDSDFDEFSSPDEDDDDDGDDADGKHRNIDYDKLKDKHKVTEQPHYQNTQELQNAMMANSVNISQKQQTNSNGDTVNNILGRCKALYSYTPKLYDELELNPGDIIEVHAKQDDGWWLGELRNQVGIFPATYVEEFA